MIRLARIHLPKALCGRLSRLSQQTDSLLSIGNNQETTTTKPFFHQAAIDNMAEHQRPYVPAKTLSTEYPVSTPLSRQLELVLNFLLQSSSTVTRTYISTIIPPMFVEETLRTAFLVISSVLSNTPGLPITPRALLLQLLGLACCSYGSGQHRPMLGKGASPQSCDSLQPYLLVLVSSCFTTGQSVRPVFFVYFNKKILQFIKIKRKFICSSDFSLSSHAGENSPVLWF